MLRYEGTPLLRSIPGVDAITVLSAVAALIGTSARVLLTLSSSLLATNARFRWRVLHTGVVRVFRAIPASTVDTFHTSLH